MGSITETPPFELRVVLELKDVVDDDQDQGDREDVATERLRCRSSATPLHTACRPGDQDRAGSARRASRRWTAAGLALRSPAEPTHATAVQPDAPEQAQRAPERPQGVAQWAHITFQRSQLI